MKYNFKQYLEEGRDSPLYHATEYLNIEIMLKKNEITDYTVQPMHTMKKKQAKYAAGDPKYKDLKGVSLTRNMRFAKEWINGLFGPGGILELDQRKIVQRHKLVPYNFYNYEGTRQGNHELGLGFDGDVGEGHPYNQYEEYLVGPLKNLDKYLKKIIVFDDKWKQVKTLEDHPLIWDLRTKRFVNA